MATRQALLGTEAIEDNCSTFAGTIAWFQPSNDFEAEKQVSFAT
jgi:hypothetical protein